MMHSIGSGGAWMIGAGIAWVLLAGAALWVATWLVRRPPRRHPSLPSPLDILERRFAAGEISREEFDEGRARLREHELDR